MLYSIPLEDLLFDYVQNIKTGLPFTVSLHITGSKSEVPVEKTILLFRIVERWMKILQERKGVKTLVLHLTLANTIQLSFEDDGEVLGFHAVEQDIISAQIDTSVNSIEGIIKTGTSTGNILSIEIPV
jgi:hypothetical protein